jgi:hypothetical protein
LDEKKSKKCEAFPKLGHFYVKKKKDGPTYGKRITKRGQQYKLGLDNLHFVYGKNYRNSLGDYFITSLLF